jgi:hypothetical protein
MGAIDLAHRPRPEQSFDPIAPNRPDSVHFSGKNGGARRAIKRKSQSDFELLRETHLPE